MSFVKLPTDAFDLYTVIARPEREYSSGSSGITGSLYVYPRHTPILKSRETSLNGTYDETKLDLYLGKISKAVITADRSGNSIDVENQMEKYLDTLDKLSESPSSNKKTEIKRFNPVDPISYEYSVFSYLFQGGAKSILGDNYNKKSVMRKALFPFYRVETQNLNWGYTNYLSLHFPDDIGPSSSSFVYPAANNEYIPESSFTFEFFVNPKYTAASGSEYTAGTVMHASSSFCVSIVTGSLKDSLGRPDSFRVLLQLSHSADQNPSLLSLPVANNSRVFPDDLAFLSDDSLIRTNTWHHVAIRWSPEVNYGTGSILIDGNQAGIFEIPSSSVTRPSSNPDAVFLGSKFNGTRTITNRPGGFFNTTAVEDEGVYDGFSGAYSEPTGYTITNPFKGELQEVRIWNSYRNIELIKTGSKTGVSLESDLLFYVPPLYYPSSSNREFVLAETFEKNMKFSKTNFHPFNTDLSFDIGGQDINVETHVIEMVKKAQPRLLNLVSPSTFSGVSYFANDLLYSDPATVRRNLSILPSDLSNFKPNYNLLPSSSMFQTDFGTEFSSYVNLSDLQSSFTKFDNIIAFTSEDGSSNLVTIFDVSNNYYGSQIHPGSLKISDPLFEGSNGTLGITLRDNGRGSLYRADSTGSYAPWSSVGYVLYKEGIAIITSPYLGEVFGKNRVDISFKGELPIHVKEIQAVVPSWSINSSSNPQYMALTSSDYANDQDGFVYITTLNLHDENLNVIGRASFSQPIVKRDSDRIMFRLKKDF